MEAGLLGRELQQDGHCAVRLRARLGEEAVRHLALHHHAPGSRATAARRATRRRSGSRRCTAGSRRASPEPGRGSRARRASASPKTSVDVRARAQPLAQPRLERAVDLDRVDVRDPVGEEARQDAEARADLEDDVVGAEVGQPGDHAQDVLVGEEVLAVGASSGRRSRQAEDPRGVRVDLRGERVRLLSSAPPRAPRPCARRTRARSGALDAGPARGTGNPSRTGCAPPAPDSPPRGAPTRCGR